MTTDSNREYNQNGSSQSGNDDGRRRTDPVSGGLAGLNELLQGPGRPAWPPTPTQELPVSDRALAPMARRSLAAVREAGAGRLVAAPWRIASIVYRDNGPGAPERVSLTSTALADCRAAIGREKLRHGHWTYDPNRLMALLQAETALERLLVQTSPSA